MVDDPVARKVCVLLTANNQAGVQRIAADIANVYASNGVSVDIDVPVLPYHRVHLSKRQYLWVLRTWAKYLLQHLRSPDFKLNDVIAGKSVRVHRSLFGPSRRYLRRFDRLVMLSEYQIPEVTRAGVSSRSTLYLMHPSELVHENPEHLRPQLSSFDGRVVSLSPFTAGWLTETLGRHSQLLLPTLGRHFHEISQVQPPERCRDYLVNYVPCSSKGGDLAESFIQCLLRLRPDAQVTILCSFANMADLQLQFPTCRMVSELKHGEMPQLYREHKIFVFPSRMEGFGLPPLEAMSCGTIPVVLPSVGGNDLYCRYGDNAVAIRDQEVEPVVEETLEIIDQPEYLARLRRACISTDFSAFSLKAFDVACMALISKQQEESA